MAEKQEKRKAKAPKSAWGPNNPPPKSPGRPRLSDLERAIRDATAEQLYEAAGEILKNDGLKAAIVHQWKSGIFPLSAFLDRIIGKAKERIEHTGEDGGAIEFDVSVLTKKEREAIADGIRKAQRIRTQDAP